MREIRLIVEGCDYCPLRIYDPNYSYNYDSGWDCNHQDGDFRIADEGGYNWMDKYEDSVEGRIGKKFPDRCPLLEANESIVTMNQNLKQASNQEAA